MIHGRESEREREMRRSFAFAFGFRLQISANLQPAASFLDCAKGYVMDG
jgi:hypothetical protein